MISQLEAFKPDEEKILAYLGRVQLFFAANEIKEEKQVPVLLSVIGGKTYTRLSDLLAPQKPTEKDFSELQKVLKEYFEPSYSCGGSHKEREYCHKDTVCHNCGKKGHLPKVCQSAHQSPEHQVGKPD